MDAMAGQVFRLQRFVLIKWIKNSFDVMFSSSEANSVYGGPNPLGMYNAMPNKWGSHNRAQVNK